MIRRLDEFNIKIRPGSSCGQPPASGRHAMGRGVFICEGRMKLTDAHVSDRWIKQAIKYYDQDSECFDDDVVKALLELKQRRAEDRAKEADDGE